MQWNTSSDTLSLTPRTITNDAPFITKCNVLRDSSCIFDPLGLVTPVTIQAKIILQDLWGKYLQWDEPLHDELKNKWNVISQNIQNATSQTSVSRQYFSDAPILIFLSVSAQTTFYRMAS